MKKIILLSAFTTISCFQAERNCTDFKTGKFSFETTVKGVKKITVFERNDSIETATYDGKTETSLVRWVNDCEYIVKNLHPKNMEEHKAVDIKILTTSKNSYTFEYGIVGSSKTAVGTAIKIK
ncbi:DNA topoisomerase IV [Flavobacterium sp. 3HN19-14]|uniref:DNA topoisomerase IV n=1 Tax=Flavobacterium sp. 3HN19-14 TaxID=3448133 RepID=UPI003EE1B85E